MAEDMMLSAISASCLTKLHFIYYLCDNNYLHLLKKISVKCIIQTFIRNRIHH